MDKLQALSQLDLFATLRHEEFEELAEYFVWKELRDGEIIFEQDQPKQNFYVLVEGKAQSFFSSKGHNSMPVKFYGPGDTFGEVGLLTGRPAASTIKCSGDCKLLVLEATQFAEILVRWPKLYKSLLVKVSNHVNKANRKLFETRYKEFLRTGLVVNQLKYKFYDVWGSVKTTYGTEAAIKELSGSSGNILLIGERGTGQQMMAWYIHKTQFGEKAPFIVISGRQFDQLLTEAQVVNEELALSQDQYLLEVAEGGTLFIRDINLLSPNAQLKLATTLRDGNVNCRIIGTLITDPKALSIELIPQLMKYFTEEYKFLPLRKRKRDIPAIAQGILEKLSQRHNRVTPILDREATKLLITHNYLRGNVSELIQIIERAFFLAEGAVIGPEHLFFGPPAKKSGKTLNLVSFDLVNKYIQKNIFPLHFKRLMFIIFTLGLVLLFLESRDSTWELGLLLAWNIWWPGIAILSSFLGRIWCSVCPFSYFMEVVQRIVHFDRPVPNFIKKYDYLFMTFLFCFIFWLEIILGMRYSGFLTGILVLAVLLVVAIIGIIFTRHTWCHHFCPLGGFVSMSSIGGALEVRANTEICLNKCNTHECYRGTKDIPGCPMSQHTAFVDNNHDCKFCLNCVRNCPNDAVQVNLRVPAREVWHLVRINQGFTIFVGVTLAILLPIAYFEPLHYVWPEGKWQIWFSLSYWITAIAAAGITWLLVQPFKTKAASRRVKLAFAIVPLVVAGYIAYHLHFVPGLKATFVTFSYQSSSLTNQVLNLSAITIGQIIAAITGVTLTTMATIMVFIRTRKN